MAIAIIKYDLANADDRMEYDRANKSLDMAIMLWEILHNSKKEFYRNLENDESSTEREFELVDKVFARMWEIAEERNINIDSLIV
jgi:hypothetical protein